MRRSDFRYYRRIAWTHLVLKFRVIAVDIAGALVKLAFWISPQLEKSMREMWGRDYARQQLSEIEESYEEHKFQVAHYEDSSEY